MRRIVRDRPGCFTFGDLRCRTGADQKGDLIDGVIYLTSPDDTDAAGWSRRLLGRLLGSAVDARIAGVFCVRIPFRLDDRNAPAPDIGLVHRDQRGRILRGYVDGPPDLAIEIVTPDSVDRDYRLKHRLYERAGVEEYWIVDRDEHRATLFRPGPNGSYRPVRPRQGRLFSRVVPGFSLEQTC
jgi:Uma2 family endonuclease